MTKFSSVNFMIISVILILSFLKGLLALVGISETISQLAIEVLILFLFMNSLFHVVSNGKILAPGFLINLFLILVVLISFFLTDVNKIQMILFIRNFFIYYIFFYSLFNIYLEDIHKEKIKQLIIYLFLLQVVASWIKLFLIGKSENFIGTISISEGSIATIMPLFAIVYLLSNYLVYKKIKYIYLMILFVGIGLISNKMGIIFYIGLLYIFLIYIYTKTGYFIVNITFMKKILINSIYFIILFSLFVSLNPRANPEGIVGGSVDIEYLIAYSKDYQTLNTRKSIGIEGDGRFDAPFVALDRMTSSGFINTIFGFGPGELVKSSYTKYKKPLLDKYKIGYGGRIGFVWVMMQIGILGVIIFLSFHVLLYIRVKKIYDKNIFNDEHQVYLMTFLGLSVVYFLDFFSYSPSMILNPGLVLVYFYTYYYINSYTSKAIQNV